MESNLHSDSKPPTEGWLTENVLHPFFNGTGVRQIYDTLAQKDAEPLSTEAAKPFSLNWDVQALSSAAGAIVPYVVVGKLTGMGLRGVGEGIGAQGLAGRLLASQTAAQIIGAGLYDFSKKPFQGETRLGNAAGSMAGFAVFGAGNELAQGVVPAFSSKLAGFAVQGAARFAVGTVGGLTSYEASNRVSNALGEQNQLSWDGRLQSMASGGFVNFALPVVQEGANKVVDYVSQSLSKGTPVARELQNSNNNDQDLQKLSDDNRLARVKHVGADDESKADIENNVVELKDGDGPAKLAHELQHLRLAKQSEPQYAQISKLMESDPAEAEKQFYQLQSNIEVQARQTENKVALNNNIDSVASTDPTAVANEIATGDKTYAKVWQDQWSQFKNDPKFRPPVEYGGKRSTSVGVELDENSSTRAQVHDVADGAAPLGATVTDKGIDFAVKSSSAKSMDAYIYKNAGDTQPSQIIPLTKSADNTWHASGDGLPAGTLYQFVVDGEKAALDPYAKAVASSAIPLKSTDQPSEMPKAVAVKSDNFDWQGDRSPATSMQDSVMYELNVRGFTADDPNVPVNIRGTFAGLKAELPYIKSLGATSVELMPIMQADSSPWAGVDPSGKALSDQWKYNPLVQMAPDSTLSSSGAMGQQVSEFQSLVKAAHDTGLEVMLDVVYNHTREGNQAGPSINYKVLDNDKYYLHPPGQPDVYTDHTGTGNTFNTNDPQSMNLVLDSLRYWVQEGHVDGFRFDLASIFKYDADGHIQDKTPIMQAIENDPVLSKVKLVAEPWSVDQYDAGHFSGQRWSEWSDVARDTMRSYVKSDPGQTGKLADVITGQAGSFDQSTGRSPINAVTVHDGYTLNDLVSYNDKHNEANGENNRDGNGNNHSWNGGVEGPVDDANIPDAQKAEIEQLRIRQIKNLDTLEMLSRGTPLVEAGDEVRHTTDGNNNYWNQEKANNFPWENMQSQSGIFNFLKGIINLRQTSKIGQLKPDAYTFLGSDASKAPDWSPTDHSLNFMIKPIDAQHQPLYVASNAYWEPLQVSLPTGSWTQVVNTFLPAGQDIVSADKAPAVGPTMIVPPRSTIVLQGK